MHHLALNRTGTHDGHLDHQIVVIARPEAWQHGHLSPRFDLKDPDGVGAANHVVHRRILARHRRQIEFSRHRARTAELVDQVEATAYRGKHPERKHIDLEQSQRFEVVLVPLDDRALRHRRVFNGNQFIQTAARNDEAAHVLRQVTRKSQDLRREFHEPLDSGIAWIETRSADALRIDPLAIPPLKAACQPVDFRKIQSQCLADIAQRAAGPVRDDGGGESRALAAVFPVNVLNDLFAPLVFEIHIDVRWLVALLRDETLEQHGHARRIHLGYFQAVTNNGIGGRAPPLAEYFLRAGILHDVVHGEKERLELEFGDQTQFMLDALAHGGGYARRPALRTAFFGQRTQMTGGSLARGYDLLRIFVSQFIERERTAFGDDERLLHQWRRIELPQTRQRPQAPLPVGKQGITHRVQWRFQADRRQHVLQGTAAAPMHVHIACGDARQVERLTQHLERFQATRIAAAGQQFHPDPYAAGEAFAQPPAVLVTLGERYPREPDDQAAIEGVHQVVALERVAAFDGGATTPAHQSAERAVTCAIGCQHHQLEVIHAGEFRADDERQAALFRRDMRPHHPGERAFVGDGQRAVS